MSQPISYVANGAITASAFVIITPFATPYKNTRNVDVSGANDRVIGIGPEYSIAAGENCPVKVSGLAKLTLGGTVNAGDRLKSDASGHGVAIAVGGTAIQNVGAYALQPGASGDVVDVQIELYAVAAGDYLS